ncbi:reverse transcriptase domain-containing protein, partial [Shigella sonnei]|nr:reverse transcriptase domain-containing protein [Shigella sonnei]
MNQPEGFIVEGQANKVWKLIKSLYELKQARKLWHEKFDYSVKNMGFKSSLSDKCLYIRNRSNNVAIICLYVDDMLILGSDQSEVDDV